ncbi:MAG: 50S ribosomal protein L1 [Candidatus Thermoplasmatota archaeon]|nr:50S ribosomal protein L1 [Euryarchaeota archaeon]MBU4032394.1 50S ribosomal protein L1 [Candidatus Thermoplasmatota archaeon]MBU4071014.1 50S ribosomal protein L1 [Candidatus Thermoplasmatota archaeon]MBU4144819.1 50S ribosomal protein L1 [Candidatus Thermoplasmatota archaeon]MBU4591818.1 50S ribosomal protein L1 [Candidatus Thermoplasmatota archaeon]
MKEDIVDLVKQALEGSKERKFKESVDLAINLKGVDLSQPKYRIEEEILLPKGRGKDIKIGVFGGAEIAAKAKGVADIIIMPEQIEEYADDKRKARKLVSAHNYFVAEAPLMPLIGKRLGTVLGPRGKMPKPIPPGSDPSAMIGSLKKTIKVRSKDRKTFHTMVGTKEMSPEDLSTNIRAVVQRVTTKLEQGENNIASIYVKTTMGPAVRLM